MDAPELDGHVAPHGGMVAGRDAWLPWETWPPQGHPLIQLHVPADDWGFAHHDAGAVVDEEVGADGGPGWMSIPVAAVGYWDMIRGIMGTRWQYSRWAMR